MMLALIPSLKEGETKAGRQREKIMDLIETLQDCRFSQWSL
jgi:hypothetical protein